jgi:predicted transcriptional regulator of viral defense system
MDRTEPRLSKFKIQFLAWIQLEKKSQVETGETAEALGLSVVQERKLLSRLSQQGLIVRLRKGLYLVPAHVPPGGQWTPSEFKLVDALMADAGANYQIGGPVAFHRYGLDEQLPNEVAVYNNKLSKRTAIGGLRFDFIKVSPTRLGGSLILKLPDGGQVMIGTLARTLMDAVYDWDRYNTLPRALAWIERKRDDIGTIKELISLTLKCANIGTTRRIGFMLARCKVAPRLLSKLRNKVAVAGKSLVPLVPTRPARGIINREWGIIDNES